MENGNRCASQVQLDHLLFFLTPKIHASEYVLHHVPTGAIFTRHYSYTLAVSEYDHRNYSFDNHASSCDVFAQVSLDNQTVHKNHSSYCEYSLRNMQDASQDPVELYGHGNDLFEVAAHLP